MNRLKYSCGKDNIFRQERDFILSGVLLNFAIKCVFPLKRKQEDCYVVI